MPAQYLIRFDDLCPTMNWDVWNEIERNLKLHEIKPILAIVPDNVDPELVLGPARADFWDVARGWQSSGWSIAIHGFQHRYVTKRSGILKLNRASEFAGVPIEIQREKLAASMAVFREQGIVPETWIAPSHSFDWNTVRCLRELGVTVISDGLSRWPYRDRFGSLWVPQQLWDFEQKPDGIWTVCLHHNHWTGEKVRIFAERLKRFAPAITGLSQVCDQYASSSRSRDIWDRMNEMKILSPIYRRRLLSRS